MHNINVSLYNECIADNISDCLLLMATYVICWFTFANFCDPDQAQENDGPELDANCLTRWSFLWKIFFNILKKVSRGQKCMQNYTLEKKFP